MSQERTPSPDPDGVRIVRERAPIPKAALLALSGLAFALALFFLPRSPPDPAAVNVAVPTVSTPDVTSTEAAPTATRATNGAPTRNEAVSPSVSDSPATPDPAPAAPARSTEDNDIATRFRPGDDAPSAAELIQALRDAGETGGIAAFNPPGTSPPLTGIAVPADFPLPPGYVRHHQWTDEGEPVEAILMFAPDFVLRDAEGRAVPLPESRVVPPELAPPGLPIRPIEVPGE